MFWARSLCCWFASFCQSWHIGATAREETQDKVAKLANGRHENSVALHTNHKCAALLEYKHRIIKCDTIVILLDESRYHKSSCV